MQTELTQLKRYVNEALGIVIDPTVWKGSAHLPFYLREHYTFFEARLLNAPLLFMLDRGEREQTPANVRKYMDQVKAKWDGEIAYVQKGVTAYNRKRLIEHKLPFVVPGNQMYLPMLGLDLREHLKKLRAETVAFSPATQALVIHVLLNGRTERILMPGGMAQRLGYSAMTMTRAFDELQSAKLGEVLFKGKERHLRFIEPPKDIWAKAQPFLRNPAKKRLFINQPDMAPPGPHAGLTALSHYSMLAEPANPVFALSREDWNLLKQRRRLKMIPVAEPGAIEIEVWSYAPTLFARNKIADRLSLYLSLRESKNERIEAALAEMMEGQQW